MEAWQRTFLFFVRKDYSWLKTFSIGFAIISFGITLAIVGFSLTNNQTQSIQKPVSDKITNSQGEENSDTPPLLIKHLGIDLDKDIVFTKEKIEFDRLISDYGFVIPKDKSSSGKDKINPQPTFIVPLNTHVRSLVDGVVVAMPVLWSGDYSIQVTTDGKMQRWIYEVEHVVNPLVKVGDKVSAGQIIAGVSNFNGGAPPGYGMVEIGILKGGNPPYHVCPFLYLDPSIKETVYAKLRSFYKAWNEYKGKLLYNESAYSVPGCLTLDLIEG